jgi:hypothetical protein
LILCQEETEQDRLALDVVPVEVWAEAKGEVEWADRSPQGQVEIVSAQNAVQRYLMLPDNLVIKEIVLSVERE